MSNTLLSTQRPNLNSFTPSNITNRLSHICKHLTLGRQEDAHEFLRYLIEKMEKAYLMRFRNESWFKDIDQYSKETTPLNQILGGYLRSTVTCFSCHHESVTFQHFQDLPLDISRVGTLTEAIQGYFSKENLEECGYKCESCKKRVSASKRFSLERAPAVLCIQLKRFTAMGGKLSKHIMISEKLNLQKYLSKASDLNQNSLYRFVSMVTHLGGSSSGGHYTAVGMGPNGNFYHFDDSRVTSIPIDSALRGNAYVLFYELVQSSTKSYESSMHNGHSIFHENGHTYVKNGLEVNTNGASKSNGNNHYEKVRENDTSFSKPSLPKLIPSHLIKHSHQLQQQQQQNRQKESEPSSSSSKNDSDNKNFNSWKSHPKNSSIHNGNGKRDESELEQDQKNDIGIKRLKIERSPLPSVPRLSEDDDLKSPTKQSVIQQSFTTNIQSPPTTPSKPKSLVPYDDDEEEESPTICRTTSGIFIESNIKDTKIKAPSKQGSTISTKASLSKTTEQQQQNNHNNPINVVRNDDAVSQLKKLNHSGYGTSNVLSWGNKPTNMNKEVVRDQTDERKRHFTDDDEDEMDRGRVKKLKYNNQHSPVKGNLPNPFTQAQNMNNNGNGGINQNGYDRYNDRPIHNNFHRRNSFHHGNNNNNGNNYNSGKNFNNNRNFHKDYKYNNNHNNNNNRNFSRNNHHQFNNYRR